MLKHSISTHNDLYTYKHMYVIWKVLIKKFVNMAIVLVNKLKWWLMRPTV